MKNLTFIILAILLLTSCTCEKRKSAAQKWQTVPTLNARDSSIIRNANKLSFSVFKELSDSFQNKNLVLSPLGIVCTINMLNNGTDKEAKNEICNILQHSEDDISYVNNFYNKYLARLNEMYHFTSEDATAKLKMSNLLYAASEVKISKSFTEMLKDCYFADYLELRQKENRAKVLDWIKTSTDGAIDQIDLLPDGSLGIINAISFSAPWSCRFDDSKLDSFYVDGKALKEVTMMTAEDNSENTKYMYDELYSMLCIPYASEYRMIVLLPHNSVTIREVMDKLTMDKLFLSMDSLRHYEMIEIGLPKFSIKSDVEIVHALKKNGIRRMFCENAWDITEAPIALKQIRQTMTIDVNEDGTHAEAVTAEEWITLSATDENSERAVFYANHPFLFFIFDSYSNLCFVGQYYG